MARKPSQKQAPAANDVAANATGGHPWFPDTPGEKIAKLVVMRVAYEDRKGLPGAGTSVKTTLTPDPVPPSMLTHDGQIAQAFGPGYFEIWAKDAANRFACGAPHVVEIAGEGGKVPKYVREFEDSEEEAVQAAMSETEKVLRLQIEQANRARLDERAFWKDALEHQQRANAANFEAVSGLVDRVTQAQAALAGNAATSSRDEWLFKQLEALQSRELARVDEIKELSIKNARKPGAEADGWMGLLKDGGPALFGVWSEFKELQERKLKVEEERLRRRKALPDAPLVIKGVTIPPLDKIREKIASGEPMPEEFRTLFRAFLRDGMLPRAYEDVLAPYLRETDGDSGPTAG